MKKYLLIGIFLVASIMPASVFAYCDFKEDGTLRCERGGFANSGIPCTLFTTQWRAGAPVILIAGLGVIVPPAFPDPKPTPDSIDSVVAPDVRYTKYPPTWDGAAAKIYPDHPNIRFTLTGGFTCHAGPHGGGPFTKVRCQDYIEYGGTTADRANKGNC